MCLAVNQELTATGTGLWAREGSCALWGKSKLTRALGRVLPVFSLPWGSAGVSIWLRALHGGWDSEAEGRLKLEVGIVSISTLKIPQASRTVPVFNI